MVSKQELQIIKLSNRVEEVQEGHENLETDLAKGFLDVNKLLKNHSETLEEEKLKLAINIKDMDILRPFINECHVEDGDGQTSANVVDMIYELFLGRMRTDLADTFVKRQEFTPFKNLVDNLKTAQDVIKKEIVESKEVSV